MKVCVPKLLPFAFGVAVQLLQLGKLRFEGFAAGNDFCQLLFQPGLDLCYRLVRQFPVAGGTDPSGLEGFPLPGDLGVALVGCLQFTGELFRFRLEFTLCG